MQTLRLRFPPPIKTGERPMRKTPIWVLAVALVLHSTGAFAQTAKTAPDADFALFLRQFQKALAANDRAALEGAMKFPFGIFFCVQSFHPQAAFRKADVNALRERYPDLALPKADWPAWYDAIYAAPIRQRLLQVRPRDFLPPEQPGSGPAKMTLVVGSRLRPNEGVLSYFFSRNEQGQYQLDGIGCAGNEVRARDIPLRK
jgi:hypothetical protein